MNYDDYLIKEAERVKIAVSHLESGVDIIDIKSVYIDSDVKIGAGTVIGPGVILKGDTVIGENCRIIQNSRIENSEIEDNVTVDNSVVLDSKVGRGTSLGPFAYIRPDSQVGMDCKVGDFVEIKKSKLGDGTKVSHLTYIGDADVGSNVNLGCGVVFVNYDGTNKHRTVVGDGCFIGCNVNLVAPVEVEDGAYIGAGTTVTKKVEKDSLCVGRVKQRTIKDWAKDRGLYRK